MSDQNPHPGNMRHSQIPVGCPTHTPPPASGLTLIGALLLTAETILDITQLCRHQIIKLHHFPFIGVCCIRHSKPNFPVDSPNSNFHFFPRRYGGHSARRHSARRPSGKRRDWG